MKHSDSSPAARLRSGLYLDFDNIFGILAEQDEATALAFANDPASWLRWLAEGGGGGPVRRFLVLRCYLSPGGSVETRADGPCAAQGLHPRAYFSRFRQALTWAGFEVVDCPRLTRAKNGADVRMVIDVLDAISGSVPPEEVVLLSSDSDFLPLLHRLRAQDRRTVIVSHPAIGRAMRATADQVIGLDEFAADALGWSSPPADPTPDATGPQPEILEGAVPASEPAPDPIQAARDIAAAHGRLHLPVLGSHLARRLGYSLRGSRYANYGSLEAFLEAAGLRLTPGPGGGWVELA